MPCQQFQDCQALGSPVGILLYIPDKVKSIGFDYECPETHHINCKQVKSVIFKSGLYGCVYFKITMQQTYDLNRVF